MSRGQKIKAIGSIVIIALVAAIYFIVFTPYQQNIAAVQEEVQYQDEANARVFTENQNLRRLAGLVPVAQEYDAALMKRFPSTSEAEILRSSILDIARKNNISGMSVTLEVPAVVQSPAEMPMAPPVEAPVEGTDIDAIDDGAVTTPQPAIQPTASQLAYQTININGTGATDDIARFLADVEKMERAIITTSLTLTTSEAESSFAIVAYSYLHAPITMDPSLTGEEQVDPSLIPGEEVVEPVAPAVP